MQLTVIVFEFFRDCRVVRDPQTLKSKGYGFVSFVKKSVSVSAVRSLDVCLDGGRSSCSRVGALGAFSDPPVR